MTPRLTIPYRAVLGALAMLGVLAPRAALTQVTPPVRPPLPPELVAPDTTPAADTLTLQSAIRLAQDHGLSARAARSSLDAAEARDRAFDARFLPSVALTGDALNLNRGLNPLRLPTGETQFVRQSDNQSSVGVTIEQPLPWTNGRFSIGSQVSRIDQFGDASTRYWQTTPLFIGFTQGIFKPRTLLWDRREQDVGIVAAERQYLESREDLAVATANAYFDLHAADLALENARANAAVNDTLYTLNTGRYEVGKIGENDLLQSELALLRARASLDGARLERARTEAALRRLLALPASAPVAVAAPPAPTPIAVDPEVAVAQALQNASLMQSSEVQRIRAERAIAQARSERGFSADLSASVGLNQTASAFGEAYQSPLTRQRAVVQVAMPLVQWGAGKAAVAAAQAEQRRVAATTTASREELEESARFAALQLGQAQRTLAISAKADTVASKRFDVAKNRYVIGKIGISDLYIAQSEKDGALQSYVQALRGYWMSYYRLRRLTLYDFAEGRRIE